MRMATGKPSRASPWVDLASRALSREPGRAGPLGWLLRAGLSHGPPLFDFFFGDGLWFLMLGKLGGDPS